VDTFGKYRVQRILGRGGMGTVYEALDPHLNRKVALKTMIPGLLGDPHLRARFLREAQAAGSLNHRNIVTVYDLGEDRGQPFLAMEFIEGSDLERVIHKRAPYPIEWKVNVLRQVCDGLGHAHAHGIIHRDVKPANIRVTPDGTVKIMDFGIAHLQTPSQLTRGGLVLGTVHYMAPEQIEGGKVDHRADIFSVGAIAYELVAYRRPFDGESVTSVMFRIAHDDPDRTALPQTSFSPRLEDIILKAMHRDVNQRYQRLEEMRDELDSLLREVVQVSPDRVDAAHIARWVSEGERELKGGDPAKALEYAKRALAMAPADVGAQTLARQAEAEALSRRVEQEIASLRTEVQRARQMGQLHKAMSLVRRLLELEPGDTEITRMANEVGTAIRSAEVDQLCSAALAYAAEGEIDLALKIATKIQRVDPQSPKYLELKTHLQEESTRRTADAFVATAQDHLALGNLAEALAAAEEALAAFPSHSVAREIRERAYHVLAAQSKLPLVPRTDEPRRSQETVDVPVFDPRTLSAEALLDAAPTTDQPTPAPPTPAPPTTPAPTPRAVSPDRVLPPPPQLKAPPLEALTPRQQAPDATPSGRPRLPTERTSDEAPGKAGEPAGTVPPAPSAAPEAPPQAAPVREVSTRESALPPPAVSPPPAPPDKAADALSTPSTPRSEAARPPAAEPRPQPPAAPAASTPAAEVPTATSSQPPAAEALPASASAGPAGTSADAAEQPLPARVVAPSDELEPLTPLPEGNPTNPEAARLLDAARRALRDRVPLKALPLLESAAAEEPTHLGVQRLLVQARGDARRGEIESLASAALDHFVSNRYAKSRRAVDKLLSLDPRNKKGRELAKILSALGV